MSSSRYKRQATEDEPPYQRLLGDAMRGNNEFSRARIWLRHSGARWKRYSAM